MRSAHRGVCLAKKKISWLEKSRWKLAERDSRVGQRQFQGAPNARASGRGSQPSYADESKGMAHRGRGHPLILTAAVMAAATPHDLRFQLELQKFGDVLLPSKVALCDDLAAGFRIRGKGWKALKRDNQKGFCPSS